MIAAKKKDPPHVEIPFTDKADKDAITALGVRVKAIEDALPELPEFPETDGTYSLQLVMDDGVAALTWEAAGE